MSLFDPNNTFRIREIQHLKIDKTSVFVPSRPYHALAFRVTGSAAFKCNEGTYVTAPSNSITYMPANISYNADYFEENEIYVIHFDADEKTTIEVYELYSPQIILNHFKEIHSIWNNLEVSYYHQAMAIFYNILAVSLTQTNTYHELQSTKSFYETIEYMKTHYTDPTLNVDTLTNMAKLSDTYFRKLFFDKFGVNPSKYITDLRLRHAENLLLQNNVSISDAAMQSGFCDPKYFSRVVKKVYGYSPSKIYFYTRGKTRKVLSGL